MKINGVPLRASSLVLFGLPLFLLATTACRSQNSQELRDELRRESAVSGLALAAGSSWYITVIPFDREERNFRTEQSRQIMAFGRAGRMVVWIYRPSFLQPDQFFVDSTDGERVENINRKGASSFFPLALSEAAGRIAFWGGLQGKDRAEGLRWSTFDLSRGSFIDEGRNCDWSPDGAALVYEKQNEIYVFDVATSSSRLLVKGHDPTWRPDGQCIAFRAPDRRASLVTTAGAPVKWALGTHEPTGAVRWSPDGRNVSFSEPIPGLHIPFVTADYRLVACRVKDGKSLTVRKSSGAKTGDTNNNFHWIVDYGKFCSGCMPGA